MARRPLGQHFLQRGSIVNKIIRALDLQPGDRILEIGPGRGALTLPLLGKVQKLLLIEKDGALAEKLQENLATHPEAEVWTQDFLDTSWDQLTESLGENFKVLSNLPYEAATAILIKLLRHAPPGREMVLMFQKEVGDRLLATPRTKDFGSLSVFAQMVAEIRQVAKIPPSAFRPPPLVESSVLKFNLRPHPLLPREEWEAFEKLLRTGFAHRRKMLRQNLKEMLGKGEASRVEGQLKIVGASPQARAEELSVEQWHQLFHLSKPS